MSILTVEGMIANGHIRLCEHVTRPEHTKIYVVIPDVATVPPAHVPSPCLVHPEHAADFVKHIIAVAADADR